MNPEVLVGTVRRRRRSSPKPEVPRPPNLRSWVVYSVLSAGVGGLMFNGFLTDRPRTLPLPELSQATDVRSTIWETPDSLQIVVGWDLTLSRPEGIPDTVLVRVIPDSAVALTLSQPGSELADTAYLTAPRAGQTLTGLSCVMAQHAPEETSEEVCTPWQYVRPLVTAGAAAGPLAKQVVVQPSGLQVDPDVDGKCAKWQQTHSPDSVWIEVNLTAVAECTGPNQKPVVAQFCAFVEMADGRRMKTTRSTNNPYCDELFVEWTRERYS